MPLYKTITPKKGTTILIWKIDETFETLKKDIELIANSQQRVEGMKSTLHQRGFLSIRHLLKVMNYYDNDLWYDELGKPHLVDKKHISITHSFTFSAIIVSDDPIGIDIEKKRAKIQHIAPKFLYSSDYDLLADKSIDEHVEVLTILWCVKESIYKLFATPGLSFKDHIPIKSIDYKHNHVQAQTDYNGKITDYTLHFMEFEGFCCAYVVP
ncbi:4'-phosphopantetheinyl transferase family protein [Aquimarina brevivitae]|uniref:4'-phosphopantetheinyl transferase superfamily protein n=1 Tax=Aquimarina brevivitae TaxID=323412 RepID=A0A4Q7PKU7_9FLAO|nr:4'-phosphopantetheinyl transferase superfamily protein [Aquimarina brevivitae]RZS99592.1 4'-phosphopantetheinyl transferase superfamily protein [Aquimarina brevivitae]